MQRIISCSIVLEERIASIYESLSNYVSFPESLVLKHISRESQNHAMLLKDISSQLGFEFNPRDCKSLIGEMYDKMEQILELVRREPSNEELNKIFEMLKEAENSMSEEIYHTLIFSLIKDMFPESDGSLINKIIDEITCEERFHHVLIEDVILSYYHGRERK